MKKREKKQLQKQKESENSGSKKLLTAEDKKIMSEIKQKKK